MKTYNYIIDALNDGAVKKHLGGIITIIPCKIHSFGIDRPAKEYDFREMVIPAT